MARIEGLSNDQASFISRALFWVGQRRLGRISETWRIMARIPRLHFGRGVFELLLDSSRHVSHRLRRLADVKAAMLIGCNA
jgi:hypothetical protein